MNFLIGGDSWSQGEWDGDWETIPSTYQVCHEGTTEYLRNAGHTVTNVGAGSIGNQVAINNIITRLIDCKSKYDFLIFFHTDPLRDATEHQLQTNFPIELVESLSINTINRLNNIHHQYQVRIILIGGFSELSSTLNYGNIDYIIPSFCKLLESKFNDSIFSISPEWKNHVSLPMIGSVKQKQQYLDIFDQGGNKFSEYARYPEYFYPDGCHPNRHAHRVLTDKILQLIL